MACVKLCLQSAIHRSPPICLNGQLPYRLDRVTCCSHQLAFGR